MRSPKLHLTLLCTVSFLAVQHASAQSYSSRPEPLQPRIEAGTRVGTERSIGVTEGWMPIAQDEDSVLYGDIRWMADDESNQEGNLGVGYRQIVNDKVADGDAIVGGHAWIDRRRTDRGSNFYQATAGVEYLKENWDVKANAYMPLTGAKEYTTANLGQADPYLAGTGLYIDTNGVVVEEPQPGLDLELGYRLPVFEQNIDSVRVYAGAYHFQGDQTESVTGGRVRASVDVNPWLNVGTRLQYDDVRDGQGFIEATLRFPIAAKKRFQQHGLRARLDESPERDIDIVTGSAVDNGLAKQVVNTTSGEAQRVLHVDNTATPGGDGSVENPFNTLAQAQAALQDNDNLYIHQGDGTTTGQDQGITIAKNNVQLIGSGTDFIYDTDRFTTRRPGPITPTSTLIEAATVAPVITNVNSRINDLTGNGVTIQADKATVAGIHVEGALGHGIYAEADGDTWKSVSLSNNTVSQSVWYGIFVKAKNSSTIESVDVTSNTSNGNLTRPGISISSESGSFMKDVYAGYNTANGNLTLSGRGLQVAATTNSTIESAIIEFNTTLSNGEHGIYYYIHSGSTGNALIQNNISTNNTSRGLLVQAQGNANLNASIQHNTLASNTSNGIFIDNDTTGLFDVDLGGGTLGSTGGNRIYSNTASDVNVDSRPSTAVGTPGTTISAQHNWWGVNTGLNQGTRATFDNGSASPGSSIDASNHLTTDPGP